MNIKYKGYKEIKSLQFMKLMKKLHRLIFQSSIIIVINKIKDIKNTRMYSATQS